MYISNIHKFYVVNLHTVKTVYVLMTALKKKSATVVILEKAKMDEIKCTECAFLGSYFDKEQRTKKYICYNKLAYKKFVTFGYYTYPFSPIKEVAPKWCPIRKCEYNVIGTLWDVCNALDRHHTVIDFCILEHPEIKFYGALSKFLEKDWYYKAWRMYDVVQYTCKEQIIDSKICMLVTIRITTKIQQ